MFSPSKFINDLRTDYYPSGPEIGDRSFKITINKLSEFIDREREDVDWRKLETSQLGFLATVTRVTVFAMEKYPEKLERGDFITGKKGQIKTMPPKRIRTIMDTFGIDGDFGAEQGRTSRATLNYGIEYVDFLNECLESIPKFDLMACFIYWMKRTRDYHRNRPLDLKYNPRNSMLSCIDALTSEVRAREKKMTGRMIAGTVIQHMVGSMLELDGSAVSHSPSNKADKQYGRHGDFDIADTVWHVTSSPTESLIRKCRDNISSGLRPIVVTFEKKRNAVTTLSENVGIDDKIEVIGFELMFIQFVIGRMAKGQLHTEAIDELLKKFNDIMTNVEKNKSLCINRG